MSEPTNPPAVGSPAPGRDPAAEYIVEQTAQTRASLGRTRTIGIIVILFVLAYMAFVTKGIKEHLEPQQAASTARGILQEQITTHADALVESTKTRLPEVMRALPDQAMARFPEYRKQLENRLLTQVRNYTRLTMGELEANFDIFLHEQKDAVGEFIANSQDIDVVRAGMEDAFDTFLATHLDAELEDGESLREKLESSSELLRQVDVRLLNLAENDALSDEEKRARRAIAVLLAKADFDVYSATKDQWNTVDFDEEEAEAAAE